MASWTPRKAYDSAVTCCIQATQEFAAARNIYCTGISAVVTTHAPSANDSEDLWRRKVERWESIMTKAYVLLTVEAARTHDTDAYIGTIFTNGEPPSYEQAVSVPTDNASGLASDVRVLRDREDEWRCWWRNLNDSRPAMTGQHDSAIQDSATRLDRMSSRSVVSIDEEMKQVSAYLQDVEHGARKFLQEIDQTNLPRKSNCEESKTSSHRETTSDQETQSAPLNEKHKSIAPREQSKLRKVSSVTTFILETLEYGVYTLILRPFPWMRRKSGQQGRQRRVSTTADNTRCIRQDGQTEFHTDTSLPLRPFQVQAFHGYEPELYKGSRKSDLSFAVGQIIDVVGVVDQNWLLGQHIDRFGKFQSGDFPRAYAAAWHPEIDNRGKTSGNSEPANGHHDVLQRLESLSDWLNLVHQSYAHIEGRDLHTHRLPRLNIPALVERLDILKMVLQERYRPHQSLELEVEEVTERMESLRAIAVERMIEYQAFVDADLFR